MAPKKEEKPPERPPLGRHSNNVAAGIVGMPNVGKSTTFNTMCQMSVPAENFPFCTIDPSESRVQLDDERFRKLVEHFKPKSEVPAYLKIFDIAGLVKGAADGAGLGNAFLSHIAATDAILNVCRTFEETVDGEVATHVEDSVDPVRDLEIISEELRMKDVAHIQKTIEPIRKEAGRDGKNKAAKDKLEAMEKIKDWVEVQKKDARFGIWTTKEVDVLNELNLLTAKKGIYLVNMSEKDYLRKKNKFLVPIHKWLQETKEGEKMVLYSAAVEQKLVDFTPEEKEKYCEEYKTKSMMGKIVAEGYAALGLIHFYTCGPDEVRAWTIRKGWKAPQAAGVIHTDFERGFIKAEVYSYEDWVANDCSEAAVKEKGKYRQEGKNYEVQDGDIIFFKFNVTADKKK